MMKKSVAVLGALFAVLLSGCETTSEHGAGAERGVAVTRFHLGQPIARGEIRVEAADPAVAGSLEFSQTAAAVERELARLGWTLQRTNARSEQVALVRVTRSSREAARRRSAVSIGVGGGTGGYRSGVGVGAGATIPVGSGGPNEIVITELSVRIQRRSDATVAWEGRAELEGRAGSPLADRATAVDRLAAALFQDFPGESGHTIRIR